jgi:hypothetical protein
MNAPNTPSAITERIKRFCDSVVAGVEPFYLDVNPAPGAEVADCFMVVARQMESAGGEMVIGWQIWERPGILMEAELHAVWRDSAGTLHDVTPKPSGIRRILFLPDARRKYSGRQVDNIREPLSEAPAVRELIDAAEAEFEFNNRGARAYQHGKFKLYGNEADEYRAIQVRKVRAELAIQGARTLPKRPGRNDPCPCGSGRKFKRCHGSL